MLKKLIFLVVVVLIGVGVFLILEERPENGGLENGTTELSVNYLDDGEIIQILDQGEREILRYSIEDFNRWTEQNWDDVFERRPSFGELREVEFTNFSWFDRTASISPQGTHLAFSVSDYAAASTMSFVALLDIESGLIEMVAEENMGGISDIVWSPDGNHLAYTLHSARAQGDGISVDSVQDLEKEFSFSGEDILEALGLGGEIDPREFMPEFGEPEWSSEGRIRFSSNSPEEERVSWEVERNGDNLVRF